MISSLLRCFALTFVLVACTAPPGDGLPSEPTASEEPDGEDASGKFLPLEITSEVLFEPEEEGVITCDGSDDPAFCYSPYLQLADSLLPEGFDLEACREEVVAAAVNLSAQIEEKGWPEADLTPEELREGIVEATGLRELLAMRPQDVPLDVRTLSAVVYDTHVDTYLAVDDPLLGTIPARRLSPLSEGPHAALLVIPGHPSRPDATLEFADEQHGRLIASLGIDVWILSPRAYSSEPENLAATTMLCAGLSMVAARHYEALALHRVLLHLREQGLIDRIGLMGHSGGSVMGNALARWDWSFDAYVFDHFWSYVDVGPCFLEDDRSCLADSHLPALLPFADAIRSRAAPRWSMPVHAQDYGYPDPDALVEFLLANLKQPR